MMRSLTRSARALMAGAVLGLALPASAAVAQGTALVSPGDLAYRDLDRLAELGLLHGIVVGQRPYSRSEFARIVNVVRDQLDIESARQGHSAVGGVERAGNGILQRLEARFGDRAGTADDAPVLSLVDGATLQFVSTDAVLRGFTGNATAATEAEIEPLPYRRLGRRAPAGSVLSLDLQQRLEATSWLALRMRERIEYRIPNDTSRSRRDGEVLVASVRARMRNVALVVGREQFAWAQRPGTGLFLASDAPALDMVALSGERPFYLPGFLERVGPTQATAFVAALGPSRVRSGSKLLGYKVSVQPHRTLELGGSFFNHFGGAGARPASFGDRLIDFLPFVDIFRTHTYTDSTQSRDVDSDKLLGVDGRWHMPWLGGVTLAGELLIDDFDVHRVRHLLTSYGSSSASIVVPQLGTPEWALELTAKHMGIQTYAHPVLSNGIATRGRLLGDELGPDSKAFGAHLYWMPAAPLRVSVEGRAATYSDADYDIRYADAEGSRLLVSKVRSGPDELRDRLLASFEFQSDEGLALVIRGGGERVRNLNFTGARRNEYLFDIALRLRQ